MTEMRRANAEQQRATEQRMSGMEDATRSLIGKPKAESDDAEGGQ